MSRPRRSPPIDVERPAESFAAGFIPIGMITFETLRQVFDALAPLGVLHTDRTRAAGFAFAIVYLVIARRMWVTSKPYFLLRSALVFIEAFTLTVDADATHFVYTPAGVVLAIDIALRRGPVAFVLPAGVAALALSTSGGQREALAGSVVTLVLDVIIGLTVGWFLRRRNAVIERDHRDEREAEVGFAELAAANNVVMRSERTADLLQRCSVLLSISDRRSEALELATGKAELAERSRAEAAYLGDVLTRWEQEIRRDPDLSRNLRLDVPSDLATAVLTPEQAKALERDLRLLDVHGHVRVDAVGNVGDALQDRAITVGPHTIAIDRARNRRTSTLTPVPSMAALVGFWMLAALAFGDTTQVWIPVGFAAVCMFIAVVSYVVLVRDQTQVPLVTAAIMAVTAAYCATIAPYGAVDPVLDVTEVPATGAIEMVVFMLALAWPHLQRWQRLTAACACVLMIAVSAQDVDSVRDASYFAYEFAGVIVALPIIGAAGRRLHAIGVERHRLHQVALATATDGAARRTAEAWVERLTAAHAELSRLTATAGGLSREVRAELDRRLDAVADDLSALRAELRRAAPA